MILKKRIFYLIGREYLIIEPVLKEDNAISKRLLSQKLLDENISKIIKEDENLYYFYILFGKISSNGIRRQEELKIIIESNKGIKGIFNKIKLFFEKIFSYKYVVGLGLTGICLILIFGFDIKISEYISKMPLLSSVVDTDTLEQFENINENDDFYQSIVNEFSSGSVTYSTGRTLDNSIFQQVQVKKISSTEKMFKIKLPDGKEQFITVKKGADGKLQVILPPRIKSIQDKIKNLKVDTRIN